MKPAIVLLSGGLDSTTCLAMAQRDQFSPVCLTIAYGQRHSIEVALARKVSAAMGVHDHRTVELGLREIGGSALTADIAVPKHNHVSEVTANIPITYVPARNSIFLSVALGLAEVVGAQDIFIGVNAVDYSGYPDCRPEFIRAFENMAQLATKAGVEGARYKIHTPLSGMSKAQIIREGVALGIDYSMTHSCYDPDIQGLACGHCDSCLLRKKGFEEAKVSDPTRYVI